MDRINVGSNELILLLNHIGGVQGILDSIVNLQSHITTTPHIALLTLDMFLSIMHRNHVKMTKRLNIEQNV